MAPVPELPLWTHGLIWVLVAVLSAAAGTWHRPRPRASHGGPIGWPVLLGTALVLIVMRSFNTAALHGVLLHFLGASIATLMLGRASACRVMALVSLAGLVQGAVWYGWAADFLVTGLLPIAVTALVSNAVRRWLPRNVFSYVMLNAFLAAALAMAASVLLKAAVAAWLGDFGAAAAYLAAAPLLMFAEAFFSGTVMALVVVYRPHWCSSFDDRLYLWPQRPL